MRYLIALAALVSGLPQTAFGQPPDRPNVVLVLTDDQGYGDLGAHGNPLLRTPHLDRLHGESVRLTDYHADPTCAPTRAALLTGRYSTRTGVWHTVMGRSLMRPEEHTLAEALAGAGYRTGIFGKWHLGDSYPLRPQDQGFQEVFVHGGGGVGQTPDHFGNDYFGDTYLRNGRPEKVQGYATDVWFDAALRFIEADPKQPFFTYLATNAPHSPYLVDPKYSEPYRKAGADEEMAKFYGMIANLDENVGRLRAELERLGLAENTIFIFTTDNGSSIGVRAKAHEGSFPGFNAGMRATKGSAYDGGHRVPFFVRWAAGGVDGGRDVPQLTAHIDIMPTLLGLAGVEPGRHVSFDGISLASLLRGGRAAWPERTLFVHSQRVERPEKWRQSAVMTERYRLINGKELYDMEADPAQSRDVADAHPEVVRSLRAGYERWWQSLTPVFDEVVRIGVGSEEERLTPLTAHDWHTEMRELPWDQRHVREGLAGNGYWELDVLAPGRYRVELRRWPREAPGLIEAGRARLRIGEVEMEQAVAGAAQESAFEVDLPSGPARLQSWLVAQDGASRGAYYVYVERVDSQPAR